MLNKNMKDCFNSFVYHFIFKEENIKAMFEFDL